MLEHSIAHPDPGSQIELAPMQTRENLHEKSKAPRFDEKIPAASKWKKNLFFPWGSPTHCCRINKRNEASEKFTQVERKKPERRINYDN